MQPVDIGVPKDRSKLAGVVCLLAVFSIVAGDIAQARMEEKVITLGHGQVGGYFWRVFAGQDQQSRSEEPCVGIELLSLDASGGQGSAQELCGKVRSVPNTLVVSVGRGKTERTVFAIEASAKASSVILNTGRRHVRTYVTRPLAENEKRGVGGSGLRWAAAAFAGAVCIHEMELEDVHERVLWKVPYQRACY